MIVTQMSCCITVMFRPLPPNLGHNSLAESSFSLTCRLQVEPWNTGGGGLERAATLRGEPLASVCSILAFHPGREVAAGGNSSGRVHVFM